MTFSPFYMGNDTIGDSYSRNNNWGAQLNFSVPLDGGMTELCKQIARRHEQKMRLDQALVRALKCGELQRLGFTFRQEVNTSFYVMTSFLLWLCLVFLLYKFLKLIKAY